MEHFGSRWTDFHEILYLNVLENVSRKFKFHSNLIRRAGAFYEDQYTFLIVSLSVLRMRNVLDKNCRENRNTHFVFNNVFFFSEIVPFMR